MDIKYVIQQRGLLMSQAAEMMGITPQALSQIVNGNPTVKKIEMLAKAIGCSPAEFFNDWPSPSEEQQPAATEPSPTSPQQPADGGLQEADNLPFKPDAPADTEQPQQAEQVRAVRFTYECPKCGERISVTIE